MKLRTIIYSLLFVLQFFLSCSIKDRYERLRNDPSSASPENANVDLYLNEAQVGISTFLATSLWPINDFGAQLVRMEAMFGPLYSNAYIPENFNLSWTTAYTTIIKHNDALIPLAKEKNLTTHVAMAYVLNAYTYMTLVDFFGDVPFSEANKGTENTNPKPDAGADVYKGAIGYLDSAIAYLQIAPSAAPSNDLFYAGNRTRWITLAKTLKLRAYLTTRLVTPAESKTAIEALVAENDLIDTQAEEFVFRYSTLQENPVSRHPKYVNTYRNTGTLGGLYVGTYFMYLLTQEKALIDPRTRYYLYRQRTNSGGWDGQQLPCGVLPRPAHYPADMPFCILPGGFWGRDHGNNDGIPQDTDKRTVYGVYPAGGLFDNNDNKSVDQNLGGRGLGILPLWMASFTDFAIAEAQLKLGVAGVPRASLENGVRKSIARVLAFPAEAAVTVPANRIPAQSDIDNYVSKVLAQYDAGTDDQKLNVVMKEWYLALWGNGVDAYNNYRRTGKPDNMQLTLSSNPGLFARSMFYPAVSADLNQNVSQKPDVFQKVFWDNNPDNFLK
jgi:hypothetical protein